MKFQLALLFGIGSVLLAVAAKSIENGSKTPGRLQRHRRDEMLSAAAKLNKTEVTTPETTVEFITIATTPPTTTERTNFFNRRKQRIQDHVNNLVNAAFGITRRVEKFIRESFTNTNSSPPTTKENTRGIFGSIFGNRIPNFNA